MDPRDFLIFLYRRLLAVLMITVLAVLLGLGYTLQFDKGSKNGLMFLTFGMEIPDAVPAVYMITSDGHNIVDHFAETVQGWFLNPAFDARIDAAAGQDVSLSVRKQEKQNLLVEFAVPLDGDLELAGNAILDNVQEDMTDYSLATNTDFVLALSSMTKFETPPNYLMNGLVGGLLGFLFVIFFFLLFDYLKRRVSFPFQAERIVGVAPIHGADGDEIIVVELGRTTEHDLKRHLSEQGGPFDYIVK
jgi:hypothetical protein